MCAAKMAARYVNGYCRLKWPEDGDAGMASTIAGGPFMDVFDHRGHGSHKYIPADRLTQELGEPLGAGVYSYWKMYDDSYVLLTCKGPLAWWSGKDGETAQWGEYALGGNNGNEQPA